MPQSSTNSTLQSQIQSTSSALGLELATEFPILQKMHFFNHAGVAPICHRAAQAMRDYAQQAEEAAYINSGWYARARQVKRLAAQLIGAEGEHEIAFMPNTSAGLAQVAKGLKWHAGDNVVITNVEYPANRYPWIDLQRLGVEIIEVKQHPDGRIDLEDLLDAINNRTRVVAISHVQYASGFRIDLKPIAEMVHKAGGYLCVDAIQSVGVCPVNVREMGIDFLSADGHKWMLAPEGCAIFYCREDLIELLHPNVVGWMNMVNASDYGNYQFEFERDARRFEPGSYNIPGIVGMGASLEMLLQIGVEKIFSRVELLTQHLCEGLENKGYRVFSPRDQAGERSGIVVFEPPHESHVAMKQLVADLEKQNIFIVMREGRLRASAHFYNQVEQIEALLRAIP